MLYLITSFIVSFLLCFIFIKLKHRSFVDITSGVQKFHDWEVSRIGGVAIFLALVGEYILLLIKEKPFSKDFLFIIISALPIFLGGVVEDLTKKVSPKTRLILAFLSGIFACVLLDANLIRLDIPIVDGLLREFPLISIIFTAFTLAGVSNAFNIIDGFNGLASGIGIIVFLSYAYVSFVVGDYFLLYFNLSVASALLGFFFWNFPYGKIFLGDSGAYTIGFLAGLSGILLINRHDQVSPWFPLLLNMYPVWETIFSIYRRKTTGYSPLDADAFHFHTLVYKRIVKQRFKNTDKKIRNSLTSPYMWGLQMVSTIPSLLFWKSTVILLIFCIVFIVIYIWLYFRIIKFKTPNALHKTTFRFKKLNLK